MQQIQEKNQNKNISNETSLNTSRISYSRNLTIPKKAKIDVIGIEDGDEITQKLAVLKILNTYQDTPKLVLLDETINGQNFHSNYIPDYVKNGINIIFKNNDLTEDGLSIYQKAALVALNITDFLDAKNSKNDIQLFGINSSALVKQQLNDIKNTITFIEGRLLEKEKMITNLISDFKMHGYLEQDNFLLTQVANEMGEAIEKSFSLLESSIPFLTKENSIVNEENQKADLILDKLNTTKEKLEIFKKLIGKLQDNIIIDKITQKALYLPDTSEIAVDELTKCFGLPANVEKKVILICKKQDVESVTKQIEEKREK